MTKSFSLRALVFSLVCVATAAARDDSAPSPALVPLNDLGGARYAGCQGGLYPRGLNMPPASYHLEGLQRQERVVPLDWSGVEKDGGRIGFLMLGTESTRLVAFKARQASFSDARRADAVVVANGAIGTSIPQMAQAGDRTWELLPAVLAEAGLTPAQVQVLWLDATAELPAAAFPDNARLLQAELDAVLANARLALPNLRVVYLSSGVYGGYAGASRGALDSYESAFALKWLIESRIAASGTQQSAADPWLAWGPYLWADAATARSDGLVWARQDFVADGSRLSLQGAERAAQKLLQFLQFDAAAKSWYLADPGRDCPRQALASTFGLERVGANAPALAVSALPRVPSAESLSIALTGAPPLTHGMFIASLDPHGPALLADGPLLLSPERAHLVPVTTDSKGRAWLELGPVRLAHERLCGRVLCVQFVSGTDGALVASPGLRLQGGH